MPGGSGFARSGCVEQFNYNPDGSIPKINMSTTGPKAVSNLNPYKQTEAETICQESGIKTESCSEGGMNVGFIENGDWIKVQGVNFASGAKSFEARVSSSNNGGDIEIRLDSPNGKLAGKCSVTSTGGWQNWVTKTCDISGASGIHDVYFKFTGGSGYLFISTGTGSAGQKWYLKNVGDGYFTLKSALGDFMIDVERGEDKDGTNVCQWSYNGNVNQQWVFESAK